MDDKLPLFSIQSVLSEAHEYAGKYNCVSAILVDNSFHQCGNCKFDIFIKSEGSIVPESCCTVMRMEDMC